MKDHKHIYVPEMNILQTTEYICASYRKHCTICHKPIGRPWAIVERNKYYKPSERLSQRLLRAVRRHNV